MKTKFFIYAMLVTLLTSGVSWSRFLFSSRNAGSGSSWSSSSGSSGGSWGSGSGGGGGHK
ncbi:hypothetical protein [Undibacterium sp. Ren11W]|uniref:hypothetical protein n=1 Tax=Undibacterium sp. Ren11W TaxID=3413045 RepID=UPI003BF3C025